MMELFESISRYVLIVALFLLAQKGVSHEVSIVAV